MKKLNLIVALLIFNSYIFATGEIGDLYMIMTNLSEKLGGAKIYLKREDLLHGGAHKINNTLGQALLAKKMNKKRLIFSLSFITIGLSKLWVSLITGTSKFLVSPLVESLKHKMTLNPENMVNLSVDYISVEDSVEKALYPKDKVPTNPVFYPRKIKENTVRSVQRIANPSNRTTDFIARIYPIWLTKRFADLIKPPSLPIFKNFVFL